MFAVVGELLTVKADAAIMEATLNVVPLGVMLVVQVDFVPPSPTFTDQPEGGVVPAVPMESNDSEKDKGAA